MTAADGPTASPLGHPAPAELVAIAADIAHRLDARSADVVREITVLLAREIDRLDDDPQLVELLEASVQGNVSTIIHVLANNIPVEHLQPTTAAVEYALRLAQREVPSHSLVRAYHMGQDYMLKACYDEIDACGLPGPEAMAALKHISGVLYRYIDAITLYVFSAYEQERRRWIGAQGNVQSSTIHGMLAGNPAETSAFETETGYRLERLHVAVIAWSTDSSDNDLPRLDRYVRDIARHLGTESAPILTAVDRATMWAWLPFGRRRPHIDTAELSTSVPGSPGFRAVLGLAAGGAAGFRRSHEQARAAHTVASLPDTSTGPIIGFGDRGVAVISFLAAHLDSSRAWVGEVLGPLAENTAQAADLRKTLSTYFETGESHLHTAQRLNLHRNTVKYRIGKTLGDPATGLSNHSTLDIALALRACEFLGPAVLR
ncbi:PucR-like helix-turn-helix protein [Rhodococcus sp. SMB37]|uniref:PucR family transcriptional regulator n=1 Tax=Rhodococcus sp. SMB37 TaxID=2512213 RepID=UPI0010436959|nr:helix-turn-helix domain-containing protein [Rhodococcus sp. SMB37]TCN58482.1 PucR-like helix-turn-helix protein [Rhodococcus sp. SMB37]